MGEQKNLESTASLRSGLALRVLPPWHVGDPEEEIAAWLPHLRKLSGVVFRDFEIDTPAGEDLLQDVFLALWVNRETIRQPERWFVVSLRNRCLRSVRRRKLTLVLSEACEWESSASGHGGLTPSGELLLEEALESLALSERRLLTGRFIEGRSYRELAARLGSAASSLRTATWRLLARLRELVQASS